MEYRQGFYKKLKSSKISGAYNVLRDVITKALPLSRFELKVNGLSEAEEEKEKKKNFHYLISLNLLQTALILLSTFASYLSSSLRFFKLLST